MTDREVFQFCFARFRDITSQSVHCVTLSTAKEPWSRLREERELDEDAFVADFFLIAQRVLAGVASRVFRCHHLLRVPRRRASEGGISGLAALPPIYQMRASPLSGAVLVRHETDVKPIKLPVTICSYASAQIALPELLSVQDAAGQHAWWATEGEARELLKRGEATLFRSSKRVRGIRLRADSRPLKAESSSSGAAKYSHNHEVSETYLDVEGRLRRRPEIDANPRGCWTLRRVPAR